MISFSETRSVFAYEKYVRQTGQLVVRSRFDRVVAYLDIGSVPPAISRRTVSPRYCNTLSGG
ncbi:hypothetical protein TSAR_008419 [Trichomalopsis sarcophagae]|uniref:Uncharacterized protein n=1 Tax=Trichomalopsis sarcophagae TaxID=543379 RepID=A0A232FKE2_9HYME|nr:hypothetical protein TSAR_008419 [Trichomalopsis sarcophagae]